MGSAVSQAAENVGSFFGRDIAPRDKLRTTAAFREITDADGTFTPCVIHGDLPKEFLRGTFMKQQGIAFAEGQDLLDGLAGAAIWHFPEDGQAVYTSVAADSWAGRAFRLTRNDAKGAATMWSGTATDANVRPSMLPRSIMKQCIKGLEKHTQVPNPNVAFHLLKSVDGGWHVRDDGISPCLITEGSNFEAYLLKDDTKALDQSANGANGANGSPNGSKAPQKLRSDGCTVTENNTEGMLITGPAHFLEAENGEDTLRCGIVLKINYGFGPPTFEFIYRIFRNGMDLSKVSPCGEHRWIKVDWTKRHSVAPEAGMPYCHTVCETEKHFVLVLPNMRMNHGDLLDGKMSEGWFGVNPWSNDATVEFLCWDKAKLLDESVPYQEATPVHLKSEKASMHWHTANAFDNEDGSLTIDITFTSNAFSDGREEKEARPNTLADRGGVARYRVSPQDKKVEIVAVRDAGCEFPACNPKFYRKPSSQYWLPSFVEGDEVPTGMLKLNVATGDICRWDPAELQNFGMPGKFIATSEGQMVPKSGATGEDDGWVAFTAIVEESEGRDQGCLVIADAHTMKTVCVAATGRRVNMGLHSLYVPGSREWVAKM